MSTEKGTYRLVTRSDMDGLVCAILLKKMAMIDTIEFAHPKDVQDGKIELTDNDITTNLPYVESVHLAFDHHASEIIRVGEKRANYIIDPDAPSAARVVYDHFGGKETFSDISDEMMTAVDKADSAQYSLDDVLNPTGWELLSFLMDPRTGLGRYKDFRVSNYTLMMDLIDYCVDHSIDDILNLPDVKERVDLYFEHQEMSRDQLKASSTQHSNLVVVDFRDDSMILAGNRFVIYALYPGCDLSMHILWGREKQNTVFAVGKSIINRTSNIDIGKLMLEHGGGGHQAAGSCQIDNDKAAQVRQELIERLTAGG